MKLYVFRNEPDTGYYFCTDVPQPIYGDDMRRVVYTNYGDLIGVIPTLTFERLFPALKFAGGGYRVVDVEEVANQGWDTRGKPFPNAYILKGNNI